MVYIFIYYISLGVCVNIKINIDIVTVFFKEYAFDAMKYSIYN